MTARPEPSTIAIEVYVKVTMDELSRLPNVQRSAVLDGIAKVIAANSTPVPR